MAETTEAVQEQTQQDQQAENTEQQQTDAKGNAQSVEFPEADTNQPHSTGAAGVDILLGMTLPISVCIGQATIPVNKLLQLGPGSVVKLNKFIDEPVELYLKDVKFATGEVVVVDDRFGIRIKEVIGSPHPAKQTPGTEK